MSASFPATPGPAPSWPWLAHLARGMGLTCLLLALLAHGFSKASETLCNYSMIMVLVTALLSAVTVIVGLIARHKMACGLAGASLLIVLLTFMGYDFPPCRERMPANDISAADSLDRIVTAQKLFAAKDAQRSYAATLEQLGPSGVYLIDEAIARGEKNGFRFTLEPGPRDATGRISTFTVLARPVEFGRTGYRNFFTDESGVVRVIRKIARPPRVILRSKEAIRSAAR